MKEDRRQGKMISIWTWVGLVLTSYGVLVSGTGIYSIHSPQLTVLGGLHPRIWWGGIMVIAGVLFLAILGRQRPANPDDPVK